MESVYVLPGVGIFPEGITEDPDGVTFYVSGSANGTIYRGRTTEPELEVWAPGGADGRTQVLGMAVDGAGRLLACGGKTGELYAFDTATAELVARHAVPGEAALLNDVCVAGDSAYVTDSLRPIVWRVPLGEKVGVPEVFSDFREHGVDPEAMHYLNGVVPARDGGGLIVAAQGTGVLWRVDLATGKPAAIDLGGVGVNGDGLVYVGDVLYVCDNIDEPDGTVTYWLTAVRLGELDGVRGELLGRWKRAVADTPTTVAYLDGRLYLVNSQFMGRRDGTAAAPFTVSALPPPL